MPMAAVSFSVDALAAGIGGAALRRDPPMPDLTPQWLETPTAFWLHPEGPLSDTTREEWLAKETLRLRERVARAERKSRTWGYQPYQASPSSSSDNSLPLGALVMGGLLFGND